MITKLLLSLALGLVMFASVLQADDQRTAALLRKADEILHTTEVVSDRAVGYSGECPEANWALSVIYLYDKNVTEHFSKLTDSSGMKPAGVTLCLLMLKSLDEALYLEKMKELRPELQRTSLEVETMRGCMGGQESILSILDSEQGDPKTWLLRKKLPDLVDTVHLSPSPPTDWAHLINVELPDRSAEFHRVVEKAPASK